LIAPSDGSMLAAPMPELPEVETTRRGVRPHVLGRRVERVVVRDARLRWPVPPGLGRALAGATIVEVERRAKYLLFRTAHGTAILHLGMSGSLRVLDAAAAPQKHDHVDVVLDDGKVLRLRDPRRFGCLLFTRGDPHDHPLLRELGPEPLSRDFGGAHLFERSRGRTAAVKTFVMDAAIVVGVGNIYANEALWRARLAPRRRAGRVTRAEFQELATRVKEVLADAIARGGTTLRDFQSADGEPGHFRMDLAVYDRAGEPCLRCKTPIRTARVGQRSAFFCPRCQN
jgi:formamidopyrimidine-DNA glycosylase